MVVVVLLFVGEYGNIQLYKFISALEHKYDSRTSCMQHMPRDKHNDKDFEYIFSYASHMNE